MNVNEQGPLSDASKGLTFGQMIRDYDPMEGVKWRFGKPNYERVNKLYFENRSKNHAEGSLEMVVQTIVKNWEVGRSKLTAAVALFVTSVRPSRLYSDPTTAAENHGS